MSSRRVNAALCALFALSAGVAVNVTFLQRGPAANWAVRGVFQPVARGASPEARLETSANPSHGPLPFRQSSPVFGVGGHDARPIDGIANTPSPQPGSTAGDVGRIAEGASTVTASNGGDVIRAVQRELGRRGYSAGLPNGVANEATREAIMAYQRDHALPLTGEASDALLKAIVFESFGTVRAPGNLVSTEQGNDKAPIIRAAIKPHSSTSRASQRTTPAVSHRCAGVGLRASRSTCERSALARVKERHGTVLPRPLIAIGAAHSSAHWTARPRVYGWKVLTNSASAPRPTASSIARKPMSGQKYLDSAIASTGIESQMRTQFWNRINGRP